MRQGFRPSRQREWSPAGSHRPRGTSPLASRSERSTTMMNHTLLVLVAALACCLPAGAQELKAGAAAEILAADDGMVIGGGIGPGKARGQEGELRASAVVVGDPRGGRVALVACDVLMIERDVLDRAARRV